MTKLKKLKRYFLTGIATLLPLVITFWCLKWLFLKIDKLLLEPALFYFKDYMKYPGFEILARLIILLALTIGIVLLGFLVSFLFFRNLLGRLEEVILKLPLVGRVYNSIKQIIIAIVGEGKHIFKKVVLVEYPKRGIFCIGFITAEAEKILNQAAQEELVAIFIPTTPNPTSGMLVYLPKNAIKILDLDIEEAMRIVISAGTVAIKNND